MDREDYRRLVKLINLEALELLDLQHHREIHLSPPLIVSHELQFRLAEVSPQAIVGMADFTLRGRPQEGDSDQLSIRMTWRLVYRLEEKEDFQPTEELADEFFNRNVPINLWPYIRETVSGLTAKMGLQPLVLPTLKVLL